MNTRLQKLYKKIAVENREKILRNDIEIDGNIGNQIQGVTLQIDLSDEVKQSVKTIQQELTTIELKSLYLTPLEFAHISFNQVVYWNGHYQLDIKKTWESISQEFIEKFTSLNKAFPYFSITFTRLVAAYGAIIFCAEDETDKLEKLRESFFKLLPFPKETPKRNHMVHTSIARYTTKFTNPEKLLQFIENADYNIPMIISEIILRNENRYPSLDTTEITRIKLAP